VPNVIKLATGTASCIGQGSVDLSLSNFALLFSGSVRTAVD